MRHQPHHVSTRIADPGDVVHGAIRVADIPQHDAVFIAKVGERLGRTGVVPFEVIDGNSKDRTPRGFARQRRVRGLDPQRDSGTQELESPVLLERSRQ